MASVEANIPPIAWYKDFGLGSIQMSWEACALYGMDPAAKVETNNDEPFAGLYAAKQGNLPGVNLVIVSAEEFDFTQINMRGYVYGPNEPESDQAPNVNAVVGFQVTKHDSFALQQKFIRSKLHSYLNEYWIKKLEKEGFPYVIGHLLVGVAANQILKHNESEIGKNHAWRVGQRVHRVLCDKPHTEQLKAA